MNSELYTLQELADTYLRYISSGLLDISRWEVHRAIMEKLNITEEEPKKFLKINIILHNLDKEIGLYVDIDYDEDDFRKMAKRLAGKLKMANRGE